MQKNDDNEKALEPYDEEGFVYDFLIPPNEKPLTEVDDDATKAVDLEEDGEDEEEFNDEGMFALVACGSLCVSIVPQMIFVKINR